MKTKKPTRKQQILEILKNPMVNMTCGEICKRIIQDENLTGNVAHYLSGSISSKLNKLVKEGVLEYNPDLKGPRGGYVYQLKTVTK